MQQIGKKNTHTHSGNRCTFYLLWWFPSVTYSLSNVHIDCLLFFFFFSISVRQFMYGILQARSGLNSLIWARLVYVVSETIVFGGHHRQIDRYCRAPTPCQFSERQRVRSLCVIRREIDFCVHLVCPSLCVSKLNLERPMMYWRGAPWITLLKDASAQNISQKRIGSVLPFAAAGCCRSGHVLIVRRRVMSCRDEANVWQPGVWLQQHELDQAALK